MTGFCLAGIVLEVFYFKDKLNGGGGTKVSCIAKLLYNAKSVDVVLSLGRKREANCFPK